MRRVSLFALGFGAICATQPAWAQEAAAQLSPLTYVVVWIAERQRAFHETLTDGLRALTDGGGAMAALGLIGASFLYGIFHAAGPGHGKAVLSTYLLTHRQNVARGLGLAAAAALCQGVTAIVLVYGLIVVAGWLPRETSGAVLWSERLSYALVLALGGYLAMRAVLGLLGSLNARRTALAGHGHEHGHNHGHDDHCGHSHGPDASQIGGAASLQERAALVLSIGLRPCSGAVLVLVFARIAGLAWAGIASVLAMSIGTAIATAALAAAAVFARDKAALLAGGNAPRLALAGRLVGLAGGLLVMAIGFSLLAATWQRAAHPLGLG